MRDPRVTVAVPLYRSRAFLDNLRRNLQDMAAADNVAVIVSDRHCLDDTVDVLRAEWRGDPRFRFIKASDRLNWVEHMNRLLAEAGGEYFRWAPHDDVFPPDCLDPLVRRLDSDPSVILAYGPTRAIDARGARLPARDRLYTHPVPTGGQWRFRDSLDIFWRGSCDGAFKGLFRRGAVIDAGLWIRPTRDLVFAERAWLFGVSLLGGLAEETDSEYYKRFHRESTSAGWKPGPLHVASAAATMCSYLRDFGPPGPARLRGIIHQWTSMARFILR